MSTAVNPAQSAQPRRRIAFGATDARPRFIGLDAVANILYRTTRNEDTRCYFCKNNRLRTFIDVHVTGGKTSEHNRSHAIAENCAAMMAEVAQAISSLPSLEQIQENLPPVGSHGSCSTGGGHSAPSVFKAKVEPLVQIQLAPGSSKIVELPKPTEFQPPRPRFHCALTSSG